MRGRGCRSWPSTPLLLLLLPRSSSHLERKSKTRRATNGRCAAEARSPCNGDTDGFFLSPFPASFSWIVKRNFSSLLKSFKNRPICFGGREGGKEGGWIKSSTRLKIRNRIYIVEHSMLRIRILCFYTIRIVIDGQGEGVNYIEGKMWKFRCKRVLWKLLIRRG